MITYDFGVGGYDVLFRLPELSSGQWVGVKSNIGIKDTDTPATATNTLRIGDDGTNYLEVYNSVGTLVERFDGFDNFGLVRVVFHNEFLTVYVDQRWVHTFCFSYVYHPDQADVDLLASGAITVTDIRLKELSDWREAIFIDLETDSMNVISSVILQRPVDIRPTYDGGLSFDYDPPRDTVVVTDVREYEYALTENRQASSDGIAYFTNVAVIVDPKFAEDYGFVTRLYRLPDLDNGAIRAVKVMQDRAREGNKPHSVRMRIRPELEVGDILHLQLALSGTGTVVDKQLIVERLDFIVGDAQNTMRLEGREYGA